MSAGPAGPPVPDANAVQYDAQGQSVTLKGTSPVALRNIANATADTDAVAYGQAKGLAAKAVATANSYADVLAKRSVAAANAYTDSRVSGLQREIDTGVATSVAMAGLSLPTLRTGEKALSIGLGGYGGIGAVAVAAAYAPSDTTSWQAKLGRSGSNTIAVAVSFTSIWR